jgi:hypothetical protein
MRRTVLTLFLAVVAATLAVNVVVATTFYRWVDADGVVHYSDRPAPGSKKIEVEDARPSGTAGNASSRPRAAPATAASSNNEPYSACEVLRPAAEQTLVNVQSVTVELSLEPQLRQGDSVSLLLDGSAVADQPKNTTNFVLAPVFRGTHSVAAKVVDLSGRTVCQTSAVTFYVRQPSVLAPANPQRPQKKP